jgi:maltooligosyltrehalose trehalohydrolase
MPVGAEPIDDRHTHVRVWAPKVRRVDVVVTPQNSGSPSAGRAEPFTLAAEAGGYFAGTIDARVGDLYQFRLDDGEKLLPDPASRFQPAGPHGPSEIVDPAAFAWSDGGWPGIGPTGQVIYELHLGTFTPEGTYAAAAQHLPALADLGITMIELMPVAEFDGPFGWGYDGVDLFAPFHRYGRPDDLRRFVDRAHGLGMAVILDVVYNHLGPVGNYLREFSPAYFSTRYENEWGDALNFDGDDAGPVRELFISNAAYWIDEFHFDGLRLDATQQIFDASDDYIVAAVVRAARAAAVGRRIYITSENEPQHTRFVRPPDQGGYGTDSLWNDDFHHSAMVALTSRAEAYYSDTRGEPQEFIACAKYGYLFQGQHYHWQRKPRGTYGLDLPAHCFVTYLQNHDQVANSAHGLRGHQLTSPAEWRAMTALWLLLPGTPMFFQGQEFAASSPFLYFAAFDADLNAAIRRGRAEFLQQFPSVADFERQALLADPSDPSTFVRSTLDHRERDRHAPVVAMHRDLLRLRRETRQLFAPQRGDVDGTVIGPDVFALRYLDPDPARHRLLIVNLDGQYERPSVADPLVAPPPDLHWELRWSSEDPKYGGTGTPDFWPTGSWCVPGRIAAFFEPRPGAPTGLGDVQRRTA